MILTIVGLFVLYWAALSYFAYSSLKKIFKKYHNIFRMQTPQKFNAFQRMDFGKWDEETLLRNSYMIFPARATVMTSFIIMYAIITTMHKYIKFPSIFFIDLFRKYYGGNALKFCYKFQDQFDSSQPIDTPIVIGNHSAWIDPFYFGTILTSMVSFVAKKEVSKMPFINACAQFLQCILIERSSTEARQKVLKDIKDRVKNYETDPKSYNPICIYPEGTVSNGRSIMTFKNGAFQTLSPITMFCLKYISKQFHMGDNQTTVLQNYILTFCANCVIKVKKEKIAAQEGETVEQYRERCRKRMAEMWGFKIYDVEYKDFCEYEKSYNEKLSQLQKQKSSKSS